jgi:hypothetical protein
MQSGSLMNSRKQRPKMRPSISVAIVPTYRPTRQGQHPLAKAAVGLNEQIFGVTEQDPERHLSD